MYSCTDVILVVALGLVCGYWASLATGKVLTWLFGNGDE